MAQISRKMEHEDCIFVGKTRLSEGDQLFNRNAYQILMEGVAIKQEYVSGEANHGAAIDFGVSYEPRNEPIPLNRSEAQPKKPEPKVIQHRQCSRIEKVNSAAVLRHLVRRPQSIADVRDPSVSAELANEGMAAVSSASKENIVEQQLVHFIYGGLDGNNSSQSLNLTDSRIINGMLCATTNQIGIEPSIMGSVVLCNASEMEDNSFSQTLNSAHSHIINGLPCATTNQMDVESNVLGSVVMHGNAGEPQTFNAAGRADTANAYGVMTTAPAQHFEPADAAAARYVQIEMNASNSRLIEETHMYQMHPNQAAENLCNVCARTFKTPKNLKKHLKSKLHMKKILRLIKQNAV